MFLRQLFLLTVSNFFLTVSNFLLTVSKFLLTVSKFLLTVSNFSLTVSNFSLCTIHMIIAPAYASRCVTKTQNGSDFHLQGITCFHLIHDSLGMAGPSWGMKHETVICPIMQDRRPYPDLLFDWN